MKKQAFSIGCWFLLLIFSAIQVLPALHHHSDLTTHVSWQKSTDTSKGHQLEKHTNDCSICTFIAHKQIDYPSFFDRLSIDCWMTKPIRIDINFSQQLFFSAVHTWTNKGPPVL